MIYLDHGATSMPKAPGVMEAVTKALRTCGNPGRGGHRAAKLAAETVFDCRTLAAELFGCSEEQVVFTSSCTHGLNIAIRSLVKPGDRVIVSGFEHNAVMRPLYALEARIRVAGRELFDREDTLRAFRNALEEGADAAVFTHVSNVFGYILPVRELAALCREYKVPFVVDAAQSAGALPVEPEIWGANFVAMPGHKGLLAPQGTGILLCRDGAEPLLMGGTGSDSRNPAMPEFLPDRLEAGTLNVPGIAGLGAGLRYVIGQGTERIGRRERSAAVFCVESLRKRGLRVFGGEDQLGTVSFLPQQDPEEVAEKLARHGIALRAGLHCAPLAHESAGTLDRGTVRVSFGHDATREQVRRLLQAIKDSEVM